MTTDYALRIAPPVVAPPPVINAPAGAVVVAADAGAVSVATFVLESGEGTFASVTQGDLRTGGGDEAAVTLERPATEAFASDNLTLSLTLTATGEGGSDTATIRFVSAPLAINNGGETFTMTFASADAVANAEVLAGGASGLAIWHFNEIETYKLSGADSASFDVDGVTGEVEIGNDALAADTTYNFDLQLSGGEGDDEVIATRAIQVIVDASPLAVAAAAAFVREIAEADFNWFAARNAENPANDWDDDGVLNPYDWTPTSVTVTMADGAEVEVEVNLNMSDADGSVGNPWPIYNVWQLQAIDGIRFSQSGGVASSNFALFGDKAARLGANYRLAANIDAGPTRSWSGGGFRPIGRVTGLTTPSGGDFFQGALNGGGYEIRGISINFPNDDHVGLFSGIGADGSVVSLQLMDLSVIGGHGATGGGDRRF